MYEKELTETYEDMKLFWNINETTLKDKNKLKIKRNINRNLFIPKCFVFLTSVGLVSYIVELLKSYTIYYPNFISAKFQLNCLPLIIKFCGGIYAFINIQYVVAFDMLTVCIALYLKMEFELLGYTMKNIINSDVGSKKEKLKGCVEYHCFLLK